MRKVKFTETVLRDAHQSLIATRMTTEDMLPILERIDRAGYHAIEMWGGATFDACLRYLDEDPWERLRLIRKNIKHTKLQMLLRGQNILGYRHYSDDIVERFIRKSIENGIDILRIFDALNDLRNLETSIRTIKKENAHAQCAISYTKSPVHHMDYYIQLSRRMVDIGADSICIKDMAGVMLPNDAYELVRCIKEEMPKVDLEVHSHCTAGIASMTYLKAIEAGADIVDTAISPLAEGTSQPSTESLAVAYQNLGYEVKLDLNELSAIADHFKEVKRKYIQKGLLDIKAVSVDPNALIYQVPGGMLSNLMSQLKAQNMTHRFEEILKEVPKVRAEMGYPPLVTPMSQMVGTQAVMNVVMNERYKMVPKEIKDYIKGLYGRPPAPIDEEVRKLAIGSEEVITCRPADLIPPQFEQIRKEIKEYAQSDEDVLCYALFPDTARKFLENRWAKKYKIETAIYNAEDMVHPV